MGKLNNEEILSIYNTEGTYKDIAKKFNVSAGCVCHIKTGLRHSDITMANENKNNRRREPNISESQRQAVYDFMVGEDAKTTEEASIYFGIPIHTVRRIKRLESKKFRPKRNG